MYAIILDCACKNKSGEQGREMRSQVSRRCLSHGEGAGAELFFVSCIRCTDTNMEDGQGQALARVQNRKNVRS